jgi:hypothetical protein
MLADMTRRFLATPIIVALCLVGCSDGESGTDGAILNPPAYTQQEIADAALLTSQDGGISYVSPGGCQVAVILDSPEAVQLYVDAGDTVVTNPAGTVGLKIVGGPPGCLEAMAQNLKALE